MVHFFLFAHCFNFEQSYAQRVKLSIRSWWGGYETLGNEEFFRTAASSASVHFFEDRAEVYIGSIDLGLLKHTVMFNTMGIESPSQEIATSIYPNPATENVTVHVAEGAIESIRVFDAKGVSIIQQTDTNSISLAGLASGVYFIQITTSTGKQTTKRVIKQ